MMSARRSSRQVGPPVYARAMWIVFGTKTRTERVPGGVSVERECESCGERAMFYERRVVSTFDLYFMPVFDYRRERVLACGACGAHFRTDEHGEPDLVTQRGWEKALGEAGEHAQRALSGALDALAPTGIAAMKAATDAFESLTARSASAPPAAPPVATEAETGDAPDPVDPEKEALLRRFAELERKMKAQAESGKKPSE